ncbi:MAG: hypothetical protein ABSG41_27765 [Bryobacteraceae bacterium]|jgi:hypothetical protein
MVSELQAEIRDNISGYLSGCRSLADVENWLWPFLGDLADGDDDARCAAGTIGSLISEYSYGDRTEDSMRSELAAVIRPFETQQAIFAANDSGNPMPIPICGTNVHFNAAA